MKRTKLLISLVAVIGLSLFSVAASAQKTVEIKSPNGKTTATFEISDGIYYDLCYDGKKILTHNQLSLTLASGTMGENPKLLNSKQTSINETIKPVIAFKFSTIENKYTQLVMNFKGNYSVEVRAYDQGLAYRFNTTIKGESEVMGENFSINFPANYLAHIQQPGRFKTAYEEPYSHVQTTEWATLNKISTLPLLLDTQNGNKVLIGEAGLEDYPRMFLRGNGTNGMSSTFPKAPLEFGEDGDRSLKIVKEADYIALTAGTRAFPWRYFFIAENDGQLIENTMTAKLSGGSKIDASWVKPGQVSWEWWNGATPYGADVNFVSGFNLDTYKYFIDFASKFSIPYIIMDEGWAMSTRDPYTPNPKVDVHEIIRYGKEKGVGVVLWLTWLVVEENFEVFEKLSSWGVKGVKIDFMDRSDQWMVNYYERVAAEAAKHKLFVAFHGSFTPAGLEYRYPNVLAYEGVRGMEQMGGCFPTNTIWFPFMRNAVGPMDYTPGAMLSMQPEIYRSERPNSASIGTRAFQMSHFVLFETGLQMLADNPTLYYKERECTEFITKVPVTWDETRALAAEAGKYVVVAKRKGDKWYIGAMNGTNDRAGVQVEISLDFLGSGSGVSLSSGAASGSGSDSYKMTSFEDGINAYRQAMDYRKVESTVTSATKITINMARNGGWAAIIEK